MPPKSILDQITARRTWIHITGQRRSANGATTRTTHMLALLTATMVLAGSPTASL